MRDQEGPLVARFAIREYLQRVLKPQAAGVLLKLAIVENGWTYPSLAESLGMSSSEVHAAVGRAKVAGLYDERHRSPNRKALIEFLVHGLRYVFPAERGAMTRGVPTAHAAPPLNAKIMADGEPPPVWPDAEGTVRGEELRPWRPRDRGFRRSECGPSPRRPA